MEPPRNRPACRESRCRWDSRAGYISMAIVLNVVMQAITSTVSRSESLAGHATAIAMAADAPHIPAAEADRQWHGHDHQCGRGPAQLANLAEGDSQAQQRHAEAQ